MEMGPLVEDHWIGRVSGSAPSLLRYVVLSDQRTDQRSATTVISGRVTCTTTLSHATTFYMTRLGPQPTAALISSTPLLSLLAHGSSVRAPVVRRCLRSLRRRLSPPVYRLPSSGVHAYAYMYTCACMHPHVALVCHQVAAGLCRCSGLRDHGHRCHLPDAGQA